MKKYILLSASVFLCGCNMYVTQKPGLSGDTVVLNERDVSLLEFELKAKREDIALTQAVFTAAGDTVTLVNATNYQLWVDTNDDNVVDTLLQGGVAPTTITPPLAINANDARRFSLIPEVNAQGASSQSSSSAGMNPMRVVIFDQIAGAGHIIPDGEEHLLEVRADISSSFVAPTLQLRFATELNNYIEGENAETGTSLGDIGTNDDCGNCKIKVTTAEATPFTIKTKGDLYVSQSAAPIRSYQLLGGKLEEEILRLTFRAEYEDIEVQELVFANVGPHAMNLSANVDSLQLFRTGQTTPFATARVTDCAAVIGSVSGGKMCAALGANAFVVPKDMDQEILVRPLMKTDSQGSTRGQKIRLLVDKTPTVKNGTGAVIGRGKVSSRELSPNDGDATAEGEVFIGLSSPGPNRHIQGNINEVVHAKISSITNADPNSDGTAIASGTDRSLGQFKFAAFPHNNGLNGVNDWAMYGIIFNVDAANAQLGTTGDQTNPLTSDFRFYNKTNPSVKATCLASVRSASGSFTATCTDLRDSAVSTEIDAGTDATFVLEADILNSRLLTTGSSALQVSLTSFNDRSKTTLATGSSHIQWVDDDGGTDVSFTWVDYPETVVRSTRYLGS